MAIIGIDCGASKIEFILVESVKLEQVAKFRISTPKNVTYPEFSRIIVSNINRLMNEHKLKIDKIGIGIPGVIHPKTRVISASSLHYVSGHNLEADLSKELSIKVTVENDSKCFALSEANLGAGKGYKSMVGLIIGTGIAAGIVIDGKLVRGASGMAGEIGHWKLNSVGIVCQCGFTGCIETLASGRALSRIYQEQSGLEKTGAQIHAAYKAKDQAAILALSRWLDYYGLLMAGIINIFDPEIIVIGGGLSNMSLLYDEGLVSVNKHLFGSKLNNKIVPNSLGDSSGIYGACLL